MLLQEADGIIITYSFERFRNVAFESIDIPFKCFKGLRCTVDNPLNQGLDIGFLQVKGLFMGQEGILCIHHPELRQVTAGFGFFGTENWSKVKDTTQSHGTSFQIKLTRLAQESGLTEVICFKKLS